MNRCFEIVYLLLERKKLTAQELADRFEVSVRTIYRDIDFLSQAGIPIYARRGKDGGIELWDTFVLNKTVFSKAEKQELTALLEGLRSTGVPEETQVRRKYRLCWVNRSRLGLKLIFRCGPRQRISRICSVFSVMRS